MSVRERAALIFDSLTEKQLEAFVILFDRSERKWDDIEEVEPDEWDREMIERSRDDDDEPMLLDDFVESLGLNVDDLRA